MSIQVNCPSCGKKLKAPDSAAGKRAKCPGCGESVRLPAAETIAEELAAGDPWDEPGFMDPGLNEYEAPTEPDRKPCPMCGEMIAEAATRCRHCGEVLVKKPAKKAHKSGSSNPDADLTTGDWIACILCSHITCIAGVIYLIMGKPKGLKVIGISLAATLFWFVVGFVVSFITALLKHA